MDIFATYHQHLRRIRVGMDFFEFLTEEHSLYEGGFPSLHSFAFLKLP
jgi:hypothetical protein